MTILFGLGLILFGMALGVPIGYRIAPERKSTQIGQVVRVGPQGLKMVLSSVTLGFRQPASATLESISVFAVEPHKRKATSKN